MAAIAPLYQRSYFFTDIKQFAAQNLDTHTYNIQAASQQAFGVIELQLSRIGTEYYLTDATQQSFRIAANGTATVIDQPQSPLIKLSAAVPTKFSALDPLLHNALSLTLQQFQTQSTSWNSITVISTEKIVIELATPQHVIIDTSITTAQLEVIPSILAQESIQALSPAVKEIDLRFNLPVIRTELPVD